MNQFDALREEEEEGQEEQAARLQPTPDSRDNSCCDSDCRTKWCQGRGGAFPLRMAATPKHHGRKKKAKATEEGDAKDAGDENRRNVDVDEIR